MDTTLFMSCDPTKIFVAENSNDSSICPLQPPRKPLHQRENLPHLFQDTSPAWLHGYLSAAPLVCGEQESWITTSAPHAGEFQLANWPAGGSILPAADLALQFPSTPLLDTLGALGLRATIDAEYASLLNHTVACSTLNSVDWEASREQDVKLSVVDGELLNNSIDATDSVRERLWAEIEDILRDLPSSDPAPLAIDDTTSGHDAQREDIIPDDANFLLSEVPKCLESMWTSQDANIFRVREGRNSTSHSPTSESNDTQDDLLLADCLCSPEPFDFFQLPDRTWMWFDSDPPRRPSPILALHKKQPPRDRGGIRAQVPRRQAEARASLKTLYQNCPTADLGIDIQKELSHNINGRQCPKKNPRACLWSSMCVPCTFRPSNLHAHTIQVTEGLLRPESALESTYSEVVPIN
ncbi:hypothetical protein B0H13DRAFT_1858383 [Mycena leptocephala]|nr:hypothetical protein B0H13DRAFT_1858383 [Mycena leptocephala]